MVDSDSEGYQVDAGALRGHATSVRATADAVRAAADTAAAVRLDGGAYGALCQVLPHLFGAVQDDVIAALRAAAAHVDAAADELTASAARYERADDGARGEIDRLRGHR